MLYPPNERGNMNEFKRKSGSIKKGETRPKKVNVVSINESFRAVYEITSKGWILQGLEKGEWKDLSYLGSFVGCIKSMLDHKAATTCKTIEDMLRYYDEARKNIDTLLSLEGVKIQFHDEAMLRRGEE